MRTWAALSAILLSLSAATASAQTTAFVGGRIIDGIGRVIERGTIVVRDGRIVQVGAQDAVKVPAGVAEVNLAGKTVVPGLINAHGHVAATSGLRSAPEFYTRDNLVRQLKTYSQYGITTVYSLGDDQDAGFTLRDESRPPVSVDGPVSMRCTTQSSRGPSCITISPVPRRTVTLLRECA